MGGVSIPLGSIVGFAIPVFMLKDSDMENKEHGRERFIEYIIVQNIIATIGAVMLLLFARNKPPTPPSASASRKEE